MKSIAEKKKGNNVGEYIIYMYQMEDLLRAYQFDLDAVNQYVITHYPISDKEKAETLEWFRNIANDLIKEGKEEKGRLNSTQALVKDMANIHWDLLKTDERYFEYYQKAKPHIIQLVIEAGEDAPSNEIQVCLNAVYGLLLTKLKGREAPKDMMEATDIFGTLLSYLNWVYFDKIKQQYSQN
jgi:hypothetical protein